MTTHLLRADIDMRNLARWSAAEGHSDTDRTLHCLVYHTFGSENVPRAFAATADPEQPKEHAVLWAYTGMDESELTKIARANQNPITAGIMSPYAFRTKELPSTWQEGTTLEFKVRTTPTYRPQHSKGEADVHLRPNAAETRQQSYCNWLADLLQRKAGVEAAVHTMRMTKYAQRRVRRQDDQNWLTLPDITIEGACTIRDPDLWAPALQFGVGRHKAYGYGMLLVKPIRT